MKIKKLLEILIQKIKEIFQNLSNQKLHKIREKISNKVDIANSKNNKQNQK
jgi:hypothetical protein